MRFFLLSIFYLLHISVASQEKDLFSIKTIVFYNVENLYDNERDSKIWDSDWTPEGKNNWTKEKYEDKISKIARVISEIGQDITGTTPDIIALAEVENRRVLEDLINQNSLIESDYGIVHYDGRDRRGIDVALLYKKSVFTPTFHKTYPLTLHNLDDPDKEYYSRDQLLVGGIFTGEKIYFIVNHWPSRFGGEKHSRPNRIKAAGLTRKISDSILNENPKSKIIILGDFNDNPTDFSIKKILRTQNQKKNLTADEFYNPFGTMAKKGIGTLAYRDSWALFDQIFISREFVSDERYTSYQFYKAGIFNKNYLQIQRGKHKGYPYRSFFNGFYTGGYSDHFPVFVFLVKAETQ